DRIDGGTGADRMFGGDGNDIYTVDSTGDIVSEVTPAEGRDPGGAPTTGTDKVLASISFNLGDTAHVKGDVETLVLTGSANINGTGNALANAISGNAGNNSLDGAAGNDTLNGG